MYSMNYIGKFISNFRDFYNEINAATLTGAIDVIVVQQQDGSYNCSPFHVRFGKLGVLRSREKVVDIEINGEPRDIHMKLGDSGEAFFVEEVKLGRFSIDTEIPPHLACSPIPQDDCFSNSNANYRYSVLSDLPKEQHEKILKDSVMSIEREKWEQMSALPADQRENFLIQHFSDLPIEERDKWLQIASLTSQERDKMFQEYYGSISTAQKQQMIREQYSALKMEDKEKLFKENFPELPADQRQKFELALLSDWKQKDKEQSANDEEEDEEDDDDDIEEIFDMEGINQDEKAKTVNPKSFVAVTASDRIRKISVVKNDFIPINETQRSSKSSDSSSSSTYTKKNSKEESNTDEGKNQSKRKRKRKSVMKRKSAQRKISSNATSETKNSDIEISNEASDKQQADSNISVSKIKGSPVHNRLEEIALSHASTDFHFFSDTEVTKNESRPNSPIQSDTEFEVQKITKENAEIDDSVKGHEQSWRWGELPSSSALNSHPTTDAAESNIETAEARRSMLGGMFSFMKKTSRVRHNPESEGIYLSDLNADELDPEVAALYFPSSHRSQIMTKAGRDEEDAESGNGPSLPQSPNSVEGAIGGPKSLDSDFEDTAKHYDTMNVSLSLCGRLDVSSDHVVDEENFNRHALSFDDICADPKIYENPNLVIKINGKYYNWETACPIIVFHNAFQKHLPQTDVSRLYDEKRRARDSKSEARSGYSSWFSWRRSQPKEISPDTTKTDNSTVVNVEANNNELNNSATKEDTQLGINKIESAGKSDKGFELENEEKSIRSNRISVETSISFDDANEELDIGHDDDKEGYNAGGEDSDEDSKLKTIPNILPLSTLPVSSLYQKNPFDGSIEKYRKTLRLSSEQIASLDLKEGANEVVFSVTTAYQGTTRCKCHIYKWRWDDKIVISDIDGTITKSDVLGHILPIVGKDWAQSGVAQLFTKIKDNGYKLLYLSARAIGQAKVTREYLKSIKQGDLSLPDGPLLLNPTSLISAFHREVIEKKPEEFKISCLSDIQALFPEGSQPFYAGYGNRINDVWAYRAVGIPITRIFTINHRGELKHELTQTFQSSYANQSYIVNDLFPPQQNRGYSYYIDVPSTR